MENIDIADFPSVTGADKNDNILLVRKDYTAGKMSYNLMKKQIMSESIESLSIEDYNNIDKDDDKLYFIFEEE